MRSVLMALALGLAPVVGAFQEGASVPVEGRSEVRSPASIQIDLLAVDAAGRFVSDLRAEEFQVFAGNAAAPVAAARLVLSRPSLAAGETAEAITSFEEERAAAAVPGTRLIALFLDEYHVSAGLAATRAREFAAALVGDQLGPRDLVALVRPFDSIVNLKTTRDRGALVSAIEQFEGRKGDYTHRTALEHSLLGTAPARIEAAREQVVLSALNALAVHLGGLSEERKTIIVVTEGFAPRQRRRGDAMLPTLDGVVRAANRGNVAVYPIDPRAFDQTAGVTAPMPGATPATLSAPATSTRAVASGALSATAAAAAAAPAEAGAASPEDAARAMLARLADDTGGRAVLDRRDIARGADALARDSREYYMLTVQAGDGGRFHDLDVRVTRPGVRIRTRASYWAAAPVENVPTSTARAAAVPQPPRRMSPLIRPWFGLARADDDRTRVSFAWEPAAKVPGDRSGAREATTIDLTAMSSDGTTIYEGVARPSSGGPSSGDVPARLSFDAPPGRIRVQMSIRDADSKLLDTDVRDVVVKPLTGPLEMGTAQVFRSRTAREYRMLQADIEAPPVAAREFTRAERLLIRVPVYGAQPSPSLAARLMNGMGGTMRTIEVSRSSRSDVFELDVPLASLPVGTYSIELTATSAAAEARELLTFRVIP